MRWLACLLLIGLPLAVAQAAIEARWGATVPLITGLVAWLTIEGRSEVAAWRALAAGMLLDAVDPAPGAMHSLGMIGGAMVVEGARPWLFPGWTSVTVAVLLISVCHQLVQAGFGGWVAIDPYRLILGTFVATTVVLLVRGVVGPRRDGGIRT